MATIFHANDIRGIAGQTLTVDLAARIGFFLPGLLNTNRVLVGHDARLSSPALHEAFCRGVNDAGADAVSLGLAETPMVWFANARHGFDAAVCITASHNPAQYNGFKISGRDSRPIGHEAGLAVLAERVQTGTIRPAAERGQRLALDCRAEYLSFIASHSRNLNSLDLSVDCGNGMAGLLARDVFGPHAHLLFEDLDGRFPNHLPDPLQAESRQALAVDVVARGSDVGVIFDGDADRVVFLDERGQFVPPDLILAVLGWQAALRGEKSLVFLQDVRTSRSVGDFLEALGGKMHTWKVGRAYGASRLREIDGLIGGELAGHYYFRDFAYSDSAMLAAVRVLDVVAREKQAGRSFSELIARISRHHGSGECNFAQIDTETAMQRVARYVEQHESPVARHAIDGLRYEFADWWFCLRRSNTEPLLRLVVEARDACTMTDRLALITSLIESCRLEQAA